jgi:hypothetical protein
MSAGNVALLAICALLLGYLLYALTPAVVCRALLHNLDASRHRTFPQLNLHRARVRRNRGRLPSNGFIERAPEHRAHAHFFPERAPPIKR